MKFNLKYLLKILLKNPAKVIFIIAICLSYWGLQNTEDTLYKKEILTEFVHKGEDVYVVEGMIVKDHEDDIIESKGGILYYTETSGFESFCWFIFGLGIVLFVGSHFDEDTRWEISDIKRNLCYKEVKKETEGNFVYYHLLGKVLYTEDKGSNLYNKPLSYYDLRDKVDRFLMNKNVYDDYKGTKSQIREQRLGKILEKK